MCVMERLQWTCFQSTSCTQCFNENTTPYIYIHSRYIDLYSDITGPSIQHSTSANANSADMTDMLRQIYCYTQLKVCAFANSSSDYTIIADSAQCSLRSGAKTRTVELFIRQHVDSRVYWHQADSGCLMKHYR